MSFSIIPNCDSSFLKFLSRPLFYYIFGHFPAPPPPPSFCIGECLSFQVLRHTHFFLPGNMHPHGSRGVPIHPNLVHIVELLLSCTFVHCTTSLRELIKPIVDTSGTIGSSFGWPYSSLFQKFSKLTTCENGYCGTKFPIK